MNASKNAPVSLVAYASVLDRGLSHVESIVYVMPSNRFEPKSSSLPDEFLDRLLHIHEMKIEYDKKPRIRFKKQDYKLADLRACFASILVQHQERYEFDLQMYLMQHEPFFSTAKGARILKEVFAQTADKIKTALVIGFITNHLLMVTGQYMKNGVIPTLY